MSAPILTTEPATLRAGDSLSWEITLADYPASAGWSLKYRLINAAGKIDIVASAAGDDYTITVSAVTSAAYVAGEYTWQSYVEKAGERYTLETGRVFVKPNLAMQAGNAKAQGYMGAANALSGFIGDAAGIAGYYGQNNPMAAYASPTMTGPKPNPFY